MIVVHFIVDRNGGLPLRKTNVLNQPQRQPSPHPDKIFNVRKVPYKQFENQKCISILMKTSSQTFRLSIRNNTVASQPVANMEHSSAQKRVSGVDGVDLHFQRTHQEIAIPARTVYRRAPEQSQGMQNNRQRVKDKEDEVGKMRDEKERLEGQKGKLLQKREDLLKRIEELRARNELMRQQQFHRSNAVPNQTNRSE